MIVKFRKSYFSDLEKIKNLKKIQEIRFIAEFAKTVDSPEKIPGFKNLRQYPGMARIEVAPLRIGVEVIGSTIIFRRILPRSIFYSQFP